MADSQRKPRPQRHVAASRIIRSAIEGDKIRKRSPSFADHYSQAMLLQNSMTDAEKDHIVGGYSV